MSHPLEGELDASVRLRRRRERVTFVFVSVSISAIFALFAALQSVVVYRVGLADDAPSNLVLSMTARLLVNLLTVGAVAAAAWFAGLERQRGFALVALVALVAVAIAAGRIALQVVFHIYVLTQPMALFVDFAAGAVVLAVAFALGLGVVVVQRRLGEHEDALATQRLRASAALAALQAEELRVRREVSEGLHGTVQQRLVLIETRLGSLARELRATSDLGEAQRLADEIGTVQHDIDTLREVGVREVSHLLYPSGVELGLAQAVRMMMRRVPSTISTSVKIDDTVLAADDPAAEGLTPADRLLLVRVLEEAVSNALRHGHASILTVRAVVDAQLLRLEVIDDGVGVPENVSLRGLALLRERLRERRGDLTLKRAENGGARLEATLPV